MGKVGIVVALLVTVLLLGACVPALEPQSFPPPEGYSSWDAYYEETDQSPATTTPSETGATAKAPEDVIPLAVPGFILHEKSNRVEPVFEGEEYSAYSFFVPKANSKFENKIHSVEVCVRLFEDDASSKKAFDALAQGGTSAAEIEVNDRKTILTYDEDFGETCAIQQQGRLVIYSDSIPPFEATTFDEDVLKDAAIEGLKAIRL